MLNPPNEMADEVRSARKPWRIVAELSHARFFPAKDVVAGQNDMYHYHL